MCRYSDWSFFYFILTKNRDKKQELWSYHNYQIDLGDGSSSYDKSYRLFWGVGRRLLKVNSSFFHYAWLSYVLGCHQYWVLPQKGDLLDISKVINPTSMLLLYLWSGIRTAWETHSLLFLILCYVLNSHKIKHKSNIVMQKGTVEYNRMYNIWQR